MDDHTSVAYLRKLVDDFCEEREWQQSPKDLSISMAVEVGELLEHFRFRTDEEIDALLKQPAQRLAVAHEIADVLYHVLALASSVDFDLSAVFRDKMAISASRYPAEIAKSRNRNPEPTGRQERAAS
jgi:dCTP diphosphatase